ncbi:polyphosphate kinase 2 family protein [soil metagenome]
MLRDKLLNQFRVEPGKKFKLKDHDPAWAAVEEFSHLSNKEIKEKAKEVLATTQDELEQAQDLLYADNRYSILMIFQAMDAAGKDGTIKHVMSGVNPQGCQVFSFKQPSTEELDHTFLWRHQRCMPERGRIGIFNRSYYEDVLVVKVHPEYLGKAFPGEPHDNSFWQHRYDDINAMEQHLVRNGTIVLKFFLNVSKEEQKKRFLERLDNPEKNWKFSAGDLVERGYWDQYMDAYQDALSETSTKWAPWYVIPADHKWITRTVVADILTNTIRGLELKFPELPETEKAKLAAARKKLESE